MPQSLQTNDNSKSASGIFKVSIPGFTSSVSGPRDNDDIARSTPAPETLVNFFDSTHYNLRCRMGGLFYFYFFIFDP